MEKIEKKIHIAEVTDWEYGTEIETIRQDLDELQKMGATHIDIEALDYYGSPTLEINAYSQRLETDEEYNERLSELEARKRRAELREIEQLKALKAKYGDI